MEGGTVYLPTISTAAESERVGDSTARSPAWD